MKEIILNIYLIIENGEVTNFKALSYDREGSDEEKIRFLKDNAEADFTKADDFDAPCDNKGNLMSYNRFSKLEKQGMHFTLFERIFKTFNVPENPLICVTPIVDGEYYGE